MDPSRASRPADPAGADAAPDADLVRATARLARLAVDDEEATRLAGEFARILSAFRVLAEAELDEADEPVGPPPVPAARLRADEPRPSLPPEDVLAGAPRARDGFYVVPRTVEGAPGGAAG